MRLLHTSDWHVGRMFHSHSTLEAARIVLGEMPGLIREHGVDVVLVAGDIFDSSTPAADSFDLLREALRAIHGTGAKIILTSGNHDSAARLAFLGTFADDSGVYVRTDPASCDLPVTVADGYGPVDFYAIPYLAPPLLRHLWPNEPLATQADALGLAMQRVRQSATRRPDSRTVVLAHSFVAGGEIESTNEVGRPLTPVAGGIDAVPVSTFSGVDYVALGHIHGRAVLADNIRYCGAPLHFSFSEAEKPRGCWLVDLDAAGLSATSWLDLPVPRRLVRLKDSLHNLTTHLDYEQFSDAWVEATYTDPSRLLNVMQTLKERFPWCVSVIHGSANWPESNEGPRPAHLRQVGSDIDIMTEFLAHVRPGANVTRQEAKLLAWVVEQYQIEVAAR